MKTYFVPILKTDRSTPKRVDIDLIVDNTSHNPNVNEIQIQNCVHNLGFGRLGQNQNIYEVIETPNLNIEFVHTFSPINEFRKLLQPPNHDDHITTRLAMFKDDLIAPCSRKFFPGRDALVAGQTQSLPTSQVRTRLLQHRNTCFRQFRYGTVISFKICSELNSTRLPYMPDRERLNRYEEKNIRNDYENNSSKSALSDSPNIGNMFSISNSNSKPISRGDNSRTALTVANI